MQKSSSYGKKESPKTTPLWSRRYWTGTGTIEIAVWDKMVNDRRVLNTTLKKIFKDGDEYKQSETFFPQDLATVILGLQEAFHFISDEMAKE